MTVAIRQARPIQRLSLADALPQMLRWNAGLAVALLPIGVLVTRITWVQPFIMVCDLAALLAVILGVMQMITRSMPRSPLFLAGLIFIGGQTVSYLVHPDLLGLVRILRTFGILVIAETLASLAPELRAKFEKGIVGVGVFEVLLTVAHRILGRAIAPGIIEFGSNVVARENSAISVGSLQHQYVLAGLGLLVGAVSVLGLVRSTLPPRLAFAGIGTCAYLAVQSVGRAAFLGVAVLTVTLLVALLARPTIRRHVLCGLFVIGVGSAIGYGITRNGWESRSTGATITKDAGRPAMYEQAFRLWKSSPIVGVGTGRYNVALLSRPDLTSLTNEFLPVHDVPLHLAAETGLLGLATTLGFALLLWKRLRSIGLLLVLPAAAIAPFLVFDVFHWAIPTGTLQLGVFVGMLAFRKTRETRETVDVQETGHALIA
jgi:O-Antigen ligase